MIAPILSRLRVETRPEHDAIESTLDLMRDSLRLVDYRRILGRFLGYYRPIEDRLSRFTWADHGLDFGSRRKRSRLEADLRDLGIVDPARLPDCADLPPLAGIEEGFGCLYVLEGASLGGQVIAPRIGRVLGLTAEHGCRFFHGYGRETGAMWKDFGRAISAFADPGGPRADRTVESARGTFRTLRTWFEQTGGPREIPEDVG